MRLLILLTSLNDFIIPTDDHKASKLTSAYHELPIQKISLSFIIFNKDHLLDWVLNKKLKMIVLFAFFARRAYFK